MASRSKQIQLTEQVARFEASVYAFALAGVRAIVRHELESRLDQLKRSVVTPKVARPFVRLRTPKIPRATTKPRADVVQVSPADDHKTGRKRAWTRETIVSELATWLASGTTIDASFVTRHGPPGLVAATRRIFGRFDAALNVASLHVSKMYPDGPPTRRMQ